MSAAVVGIDPSLTATGIATSLGLRTITTTGDKNATIDERRKRLEWITYTVTDKIIQACPGALVDVIAIEGPSFAQRPQRGTFDRWGLWWLLVSDMADTFRDALIVEVPPGTLKKYATGNGIATKADIRVELLKRYGEDIRDDNQADAFVLRAIGLELAGEPLVKLPASHRAALDKLPRPIALV